ncbi:MAG: diguanylate cyclase [Thermodesulfobacteriaceae bacterium]|nr:diguanylate cyclase [Thermodesulfobacteriaceae bacterium]
MKKIDTLCEKIEDLIQEDLNFIILERDSYWKNLLIEILKNLGVESEVFSSENELLERIKDKANVILFLSLNAMFLEENLEFLKKIKKISSEIKILVLLEIPFLEYLGSLNLGAYFWSGADEVIVKPFSLEEFKARLSKLLKEVYLLKTLQKFIVEDPLTEVFNRRYFEEILREEAYRALRQKYPLVLFMIDLDKFKWYNDFFGHQAGDRLLKALGEMLCENTRKKIDKVCRYGGDEFTIILPHLNWKNSLSIIKRIFSSWERANFEPVTLSIGIAQLIYKENLERSVSNLVNRADAAMYEAKKIPGNSFVIDEETLKLNSTLEVLDGAEPFQP